MSENSEPAVTALPPDEVAIYFKDFPNLSRDVLPRASNKGVHPSLPYRWSTVGKRGVKLKAIRGAGCTITCKAWIREFMEAISPRAPGASRTTAQRHRDVKRAEAELMEAGIGASEGAM